MTSEEFTERMKEYTRIARDLEGIRDDLVQLQLFEEASALRDLQGSIESQRGNELRKRFPAKVVKPKGKK